MPLDMHANEDGKARIVSVLIAAGTSLFAVLLAVRRLRAYLLPHHDVFLKQLYGWTIYSRTVITPNFFNDGFVRRGLGGTVRYLLPGDWSGNVIAFIVLSAIWLAIPLGILLYRRARMDKGNATALVLAAILLLAPQAFRGWGVDLARTDMLAAGFVAWAVLAIVTGRAVIAALLLILGMMTHETALIFGTPLIIALGLTQRAERRSETAHLAASIVFMGGVLLTILAQRLFTVPYERVLMHMLDVRLTRSDEGTSLPNEIATYVFMNGGRGIRSALCFNFDFERRYFINALIGLVLLGAYAFILRPYLPFRLFVFTSLLPVIVMLIIASDTERWMRLGFLNAWLLAATRSGVEGAAFSSAKIVRATLFAIVAALGSTDYYITSRLVPPLGDALHLPAQGSLEQWLAHCDPQWRTTLGGR